MGRREYWCAARDDGGRGGAVLYMMCSIRTSPVKG